MVLVAKELKSTKIVNSGLFLNIPRWLLLIIYVIAYSKVKYLLCVCIIQYKLNKKYWDKIKVLLIINQNQICLVHMS